MPNYCGTHMIADVGHWIQQEEPKETNRLLLDFLADEKIAWRDAYEMQMRAALRPLQQAAE